MYYVCPKCMYHGSFGKRINVGRVRVHSQCPVCKAMERQRLMALSLYLIGTFTDISKLSVLHCSPRQGEHVNYILGDVTQINKNDRYDIDIRELPFRDNEFDVVIAAHVLEHIKDDDIALEEIARVASKFAILPVPTHYSEDVELDSPDDEGHIRYTTSNYYEKYKNYFSTVRVHTSMSFSDIYQTRLIYEDGVVHNETMPICGL